MEDHPADWTLSVQDGESDGTLVGVCVLDATILFIHSESKGQCGAGNAFSHLIPLLQWSYLRHCRYPWSLTGVLHQLGILGKHRITIEKEAKMLCRVNDRKQYLIVPVLC